MNLIQRHPWGETMRIAPKHLFLALGVTTLLIGTAATTTSYAVAVVKAKPSDRCKTISGTAGLGPLAFSNCKSDGPADSPKVNEKGAGTWVPASSTGGTLTWTAPYEGGTAAAPAHTDLSGLVNTPVSGAGDEKESAAKSCPMGSQEFEESGTIGPTDTSDGPGLPGDVGAAFTMEWCDSPSGSVTLEPGTSASFGEGTES